MEISVEEKSNNMYLVTVNTNIYIIYAPNQSVAQQRAKKLYLKDIENNIKETKCKI